MYKYYRTLVIDGKKEVIEVTEKNKRMLDRLVGANQIQDVGTEIIFEGPKCVKCGQIIMDRLIRKNAKGEIARKGFICPICLDIVWGVEF